MKNRIFLLITFIFLVFCLLPKNQALTAMSNRNYQEANQPHCEMAAENSGPEQAEYQAAYIGMPEIAVAAYDNDNHGKYADDDIIMDTGDLSEEALEKECKIVNGIVASIIDGNMSDYDKVMAIQAYIHAHAVYDYNYEAMLRDKEKMATEYFIERIEAVKDPYVIFQGDGLVVCTGYARAFELLANASGLKSQYIKGDVGHTGWNNHAWNLVEVDGAWYHIDVTYNTLKWDNYILRSDADMLECRGWNQENHPECPENY